MYKNAYLPSARAAATGLPIFVISLERDAVRRRHVYENILPRLPSARVVDATDYQSGAVAEWLARNPTAVDRSSYKKVTDSKLACTISHLRVWQTIVKERIPQAVVLEDDIAVLDDFEIELAAIRAQKGSGCDFVHLYVHPQFHDGLAVGRAKSSGSVVRFVPGYGRSAYLVSGNGAAKLAAEFRTVGDHGDMMVAALAARGGIVMKCASGRLIENLGQLRSRYWGERFRSNVYPGG
ncbi:MAG: glycosyltransferase family 25 protein [Alphaproteobacteria bacterium]|nr:glycosyltransferase family 25 protein [Alphaproteobacteria bacterium]